MPSKVNSYYYLLLLLHLPPDNVQHELQRRQLVSNPRFLGGGGCLGSHGTSHGFLRYPAGFHVSPWDSHRISHESPRCFAVSRGIPLVLPIVSARSHTQTAGFHGMPWHIYRGKQHKGIIYLAVPSTREYLNRNKTSQKKIKRSPPPPHRRHRS